MSFKDFLSLKRHSIRQQIIPGRILNLYCNIIDNPKEKFIIILSVAPKLLGFFINSEINDFKKNRPKLVKTQLTILKKEHTFLDDDSIVDCHAFVSKFTLDEIINQISKSKKGTEYHIKCCISDKLKTEILTELKVSSFLIPIDAQLCVDALEKQN